MTDTPEILRLIEQETKKHLHGLTNTDEAVLASKHNLVTDWECNQIIKGRAVIDHDGCLRFIIQPNSLQHYDLSTKPLTSERMEQIKIQQLLGLGDGKTLMKTIQ